MAFVPAPKTSIWMGLTLTRKVVEDLLHVDLSLWREDADAIEDFTNHLATSCLKR